MKLLVTGGAGFIGSEFVRSALTGKYKDFGLDPEALWVVDKLTYAGSRKNLQEVEMDPRLKFIEGDISDEKLMAHLTLGIDLIINFAAESHVDRSIKNPNEFVKSNIIGVQNILNVARLNSVKRIIQVSTDEVYGSIEDGNWSELEPLLPNSPYSASKASADLLVRASHKTYGLDTVITRCSNNYGAFQHPEKLIPTIILNLIKGIDIPIYGDGKNVREWIHVSDHARAIAFLVNNGKSGEIYNIGSTNQISNIDLAARIMEIFGSSKSKISYVDDRLGHDFRYSLNFNKISDLGFVPQMDFDEGLTRTLMWYRDNSAE